MDLLNSLLSAVTVGVIATMFTQIITNNIAKIKKNNDKLKEFGVEYIGTDNITYCHVRLTLECREKAYNHFWR